AIPCIRPPWGCCSTAGNSKVPQPRSRPPPASASGWRGGRTGSRGNSEIQSLGVFPPQEAVMGGEIFEVTDGKSDRAIIRVIGVGGGGCNTVNQMVETGIDGVDFVCANTDRQHLERCKTNMILQLGQGLTRGLGAGSNPDLG